MIVPFSSGNAPKPTAPQGPQAQGPPDVYLLMAASQMHQEGRLTQNPRDTGFTAAWQQWPQSPNIEDRRNDPQWSEDAMTRRQFDYDKTSKPYGKYTPVDNDAQ